MPAFLAITDSNDIASLEAKIVVDYIQGEFNIDLSFSTFINNGNLNVHGAKIKVVNPYGVEIKGYEPTFDILPPMDGVFTINIPENAVNYSFGKYTVSVLLEDGAGKQYELKDVGVNLKQIDADQAVREPHINAQLVSDCNNGKLFISVDQAPIYNGQFADDVVNDFNLQYPFGALPIEEHISLNNFSVTLFEGEYMLSGDTTVTYQSGDVFYLIKYKVKERKNVRCWVDKTCVKNGLNALVEKVSSSCTNREYEEVTADIIRALLLIQTIEVNLQEGGDVSDYLNDLEDILGVPCGCGSKEGTPINGAMPAENILIEGCGIESEVIGNVTKYTANIYDYSLEYLETDGIITVTNAVISGCNRKQRIILSTSKLYSKLKTYISSQNEYNFYGNVVRQSLNGLDVECLGIEENEFKDMSLKDFFQRIINIICGGASVHCKAKITGVTTTASGDVITLNWNNNQYVSTVKVYVDDIFVTEVSEAGNTVSILGYADGETHTYKLVPTCDDGNEGVSTGDFNFTGCPTIAQITFTTGNTINNATCPFDLDSILNNTPTGITVEWHTANNTLPSTLVSDPSNVSSGSYYAFGKDSNGCYGISSKVTITCQGSTQCSPPQNLLVERTSSGVRVRFQSSAFPPTGTPAYEVFRRLQSDADDPTNYTSIGNPTWNSSANRWEIIDSSFTDNTIYVYRVVANCDGEPYADYNFATIKCPELTLTSDSNSIDYTFDSDDNVTSYEVFLVKDVIQTSNSYTPSYPSPITGQFGGLTPSTGYTVYVKVTVGAYSQQCASKSINTKASSGGGGIVPGIYGIITNTEDTITAQLITTIPCPVTVNIDYVYYEDGSYVEHTGTESITIPPSTSSANKLVTLPADNYLGGVVGTNYQVQTSCGNVILSVSSRVEYGYINLDTTGTPPILSDFINAIAAPDFIDDLQYESDGSIIVNDFTNSVDKVCFIAVPAINNPVQRYTMWSEIGNPLQQNVDIDSSFVSNDESVWFRAGVYNGKTWYFTRYQTSFANPLKFEK